MANDKWSGSNPWLGLAPYTEGTPLYGRTKESIQLADIIKDYTASVVFGKSGIGKSSLLSAGISPLLREENYIPVRIRLVHNTEVSYIEQIESKVRETVHCIDRLPTDVNNLGLWDFFHRHSFTAENGIEFIPVIILDQFEEIYTLTDADHKKEIITFFNELSTLLNDIKPDNVIEEERKHSVIQSDSDSATPKRGIIKRSAASTLNYTSATTFRFVICLREDKLYLLERNSTNIPSLKANRYNLQALSPGSALEVIMCPRPELFSNEESTAIIDKLADMGDEGVRTVDPAILSLFLYKYYEKQGQANYDNIFADYYQEATKDIKGNSIAFLEDHLLTLGGYRNQVPLDDALSSGVTQEDIQSLLQSIIIRKEQRKGIDYIEYSHDRLCTEAMKNREERTMREQTRKARKRMLLSFFVFAVSVTILAVVLVLLSRLQTSEEKNEIISRQKNEIAVQRDSLNKYLQIQEAQNRIISNQNAKITAQRDSIRNSLKEKEKQNMQLNSQLALIKEQQREIEELQLGMTEERTVVNREAGKLSIELPYNALVNAVRLTISGKINGTDIKYLRDNIRKLRYLDISDANIIKGGEEYYRGIIVKDNIVGGYMFSGLKSLETIILPRNVTSIGEYAFYDCRKLTSIMIPDSVISIGYHAFYGCSSLTSVKIPNCVTSIAARAFESCYSLSSITIPSSVTYIRDHTFSGCTSLSSITIPNSVKSIEDYVFANCKGLSSVTIPSSVNHIGNHAFSGCVLSELINNSSCSNDNFWGAKIYDSVTQEGLTIRNDTVLLYKGKSNSVTIPEGVMRIGPHAFNGCSWLTTVTIPNSVASIGHHAFENCSSLSSVTIPDKLTYISCGAFQNCKGLTSFVIPDSVTYIANDAFRYCNGLTSVAIPNKVTAIGISAFWGCDRLISITIPNSVTSIGDFAFYGCGRLSSVVLPNNVKSIRSCTFAHCKGLISMTIPNSVDSIGDHAFEGCTGLTSIIVSNGIKMIDYGAFSGCSNLSSITLPNSIDSIGVGCFNGCGNLALIKSEIVNIDRVKIDIQKESDNPFKGISSNCTWHVPSGTAERYKAQAWWFPSWQIIEYDEPKKSAKASYSDGVLSVNGVQYNMLPVEGGTFMMGTTDEIIAAGCQRIVFEPEDTFTMYVPTKEVTVGSYMIGETEVTQALWTAVMGYNPSEWKGENLPVERISWLDCLSFISKLNKLTGMNFRLPTEAEWEFAARGGNKSKHTPYSGGINIDDVAWYNENSQARTHPVKQKKSNELGLFDMNGNVYEFCSDKNVSCGGGFNSTKAFSDVSERLHTDESTKDYFIGFRIATSGLSK